MEGCGELVLEFVHWAAADQSTWRVDIQSRCDISAALPGDIFLSSSPIPSLKLEDMERRSTANPR